MALESVGSVMSNVAGTIKQPVSKPDIEYTEVQTPEKAPKVDNQTRVVENIEKKNEPYFEKNFEKNAERIHKAIEDINKKMYNSEAVYGFHEETNRVTIKIIDKDTKEVIKELPPEKTLDMIAKAWELAGLLVDEKR